MELSEAQNIMRGYMAPRSHAINVFAQQGKLHVTIDARLEGVDTEAEAKQELIEAIMREFVEQENQRIYHFNRSKKYDAELDQVAASEQYGYAREFQHNARQLMRVAAFVDNYFED